MKVIHLPVMIVFCGDRLVQTKPDEFQSVFGFRSGHGACLVCSNGSLPRMHVTHILDRSGHFHRLTPLKKRLAFLGWFAPVWDFTKTDCSIETASPLTVGELLMEAKKWNNEAGRKMQRFLQSKNPEAVFDETLFRQSWESTYVALPEPEWSKVFEFRE